MRWLLCTFMKDGDGFMKQATIIIDHLKKSYGSKVVTDDISIRFYSGQILALVGHNGAGKSTLLNQVNGTVASDAGTIQIKGIEVSKNPSKARELVSSMPQFQVPLKGVSVQEAIQCIARIKGMDSSLAKKRTLELLNFLEITKWKHVPGQKLSGGLQRLTSFAMAVIDNPSIVVLDEPTNDVDPYRRSLMWRYLRLLANNGSTIIIVSHNLFEIERYADRYLFLDQGRIQRDILISEAKGSNHLKHQLTLVGVDEKVVDNFRDYEHLRYDNLEKRLLVTVKDEHLVEIIPLILNLLKTNCLVSYEIKLKNLSDDYEDYIYED